MHFLQSFSYTALGLAMIFSMQLEGYCARCAKIEEERAREQAQHPQEAGYYDKNIEHLPPRSTDEGHRKESRSEPIAEGTLAQRQSKDPKPINQNYSTLFTILNTRSFLDTLEGPFTIFIPSDEALKKLSPTMLFELTQPDHQEQLATLVGNHVVAKEILRGDFEKFNNLEIKSISGRNLTLKSEQEVLSIDDAKILRVEPAGFDGVLYIIDRVLVP